MTEAATPPTKHSQRTHARVLARLDEQASLVPDPFDHPVMTAEEAFAALGIDRSTGYKAIRDGTFPAPVIRVGRVIRIPTLALRRLLQLDGDPPPSS